MHLCDECVNIIGRPATIAPHSSLSAIEPEADDSDEVFICESCRTMLTRRLVAPSRLWSIESYPADNELT